jgi:Skp family chaperone for outer membrane proteins
MPSFSSRRLQIVIGTVALLSSTSVADAQRATAPAVRVGVIDSRQLLQEMPGRAQAESEFALEMAKARELVHTATDSMKAAVDELSRHEADLRPQQRESAMMMLRARELALEDMVAQLNTITGTRLSQLQQPLLDLMRSAVKAVRERERLTLVFDLGSEGGPIAFDEAVNITPLVLEELRRRPKPALPGR